jgi:hypothetical protein
MGPEVNAEVELTVGEKRVRAAFNPSNNDLVSEIKSKAADLINLCEGLKDLDPRLTALAQTAFEEGSMWAVKAATTPIVKEEGRPVEGVIKA